MHIREHVGLTGQILSREQTQTPTKSIDFLNRLYRTHTNTQCRSSEQHRRVWHSGFGKGLVSFQTEPACRSRVGAVFVDTACSDLGVTRREEEDVHHVAGLWSSLINWAKTPQPASQPASQPY